MKLSCPKCSHACGMFQGECPECGFSLSLQSVLGFYWNRFCEKLSMSTSLRCPQCGFANPLKAAHCEKCQAPLTVESAVNSVVDPPRRRWRKFLSEVTPATKRRIQWCYLIFSAASLWWLLAYVEKDGGSWFPNMLLSIIYVAVLSFFGLWLIPRRVFRNVFGLASRLVKLALALNGLSAMLLVQLFIKVWWVRAGTLAGLFVVAWFGAMLLHRYILPMVAQTEAAFLGNSPNELRPSDPQGRTTRID